MSKWFLSMQSSHMTMGVYIVPDEVVSDFSPLNSYLMSNYISADKDNRNVLMKRCKVIVRMFY